MADPLDAEGLGRLAEIAAGPVADDNIPGLVTLVASGDQVEVETFGTLSVGGPPVRRDSIFRISSTTKPIVGAAAMALVDEGILGLDDPVARWLPELAEPRVLRRSDGPLDDTVPADGPITVRQLLTFTFGFGMTIAMFQGPEPWPIVTAAEEAELVTFGPPDPQAQPDPDTWMARFGALPLMAQPGQRWFYNTGALVLGVLLARAAGQPLPDVLRTRIFEPLGMNDTAFWASDPSRLATVYTPVAGGVTPVDPPDGKWSRPPKFADGAAGLVSTVDDLLAFGRALAGGGSPILSPASVDQMTRDHLTQEQRARDLGGFVDGRSWGFCQAVTTEGPRAGAYGWDGGLGTSWLVDPVTDLIVIVLTQRGWDSPQLPQIHRDIQAAAYAARRRRK